MQKAGQLILNLLFLDRFDIEVIKARQNFKFYLEIESTLIIIACKNLIFRIALGNTIIVLKL